MNKIVTNFLAGFIRNKQKKHAFKIRATRKQKLEPKNTLNSKRIWGGRISVKGEGNKIVFHGENNHPLKVDICINGNNNYIEIERDVITPQTCGITIGTEEFPCNGATFSLGEKTQLNGVNFRMMENGSKITVGKNCLFSWGIEVWASDTHTILGASGTVQNIGTHVCIGDNVWCGMDVKIGKNVTIAPGCIIGWGSVVTRDCLSPNSTLAGNPAKIVKQDRTWEYPPPSHYPHQK